MTPDPRIREVRVRPRDDPDGIYAETAREFAEGDLEKPTFEMRENVRALENFLCDAEHFIEVVCREADDEQTIRDAHMAVRYLVHVRDAIERGDASRLALHMAMDLGRLLERLSVRPHERNASKGARQTRGTTTGNSRRWAERESEHRRMAERWRRLVTAGQKKKLADRIVASEFGSSTSTVERARRRYPG